MRCRASAVPLAVAVAVCYGAWVPNFTVPRRAAALGMASALWLEMAQAQDILRLEATKKC